MIVFIQNDPGLLPGDDTMLSFSQLFEMGYLYLKIIQPQNFLVMGFRKMLKEYIQNLQSENDRKIGSLEKEMHGLVNDLSCAEKMMEELECEKKLDTNIFSPRAMNQKIDDNIAKKQEEIRQLKQRMEYVTQMIEDGLKNREEYRKLEEELSEEKIGFEQESFAADDLSHSGYSGSVGNDTDINEGEVIQSIPSSHEVCPDSNNNSDTTDESEKIIEKQISDGNEICENSQITDDDENCDKNQISDEKDNGNNENNDNEKCKNTVVNLSANNVDKDELMSFLNTVYHKNETSLAFLNGNKNRARSELKSCMKLIKDFAQKVENG